MKTNYIKRDIITIAILFIILASIFASLLYYDMQTGMLETWANNLYNALITKQ